MRAINGVTIRMRYLTGHAGFRSAPLRTCWRLLVWRILTWTHREAEVYLPGFDARFVLPPEWSGGSKVRFVFREHIEPDPELKVLLHMLKPGDVVLDVGANIGEWTVALARQVGARGRVIAFEPSRVTADALAATIELNHLERAQVVPGALSDVDGTANLFHHDRDSTRHSLAQVGDASERVPVFRLDSIVGEYQLSRLDLIKIDTEGADGLVIAGGAETIAKHQPIIVYECNPEAASRIGVDCDAPRMLLEQLGYRLYGLSADERLTPFTTPFGREYYNLFALPPRTQPESGARETDFR